MYVQVIPPYGFISLKIPHRVFSYLFCLGVVFARPRYALLQVRQVLRHGNVVHEGLEVTVEVLVVLRIRFEQQGSAGQEVWYPIGGHGAVNADLI